MYQQGARDQGIFLAPCYRCCKTPFLSSCLSLHLSGIAVDGGQLEDLACSSLGGFIKEVSVGAT